MALTDEIVRGTKEGWTALEMAKYELNVWCAANVIGNGIFGLDGKDKIDFSCGSIRKLAEEITTGKWESQTGSSGSEEKDTESEITA